MVDLPGQGKMPYRNQTFRVDMNEPISIAIDWLENNALKNPKNIAIYCVSGGGYFTAESVTNDERIDAWIASSPITDVTEIFRKEFDNALKTPGLLIKTGMKFISSINESANINLRKYAWQFGTDNFKTVVEEVFKQVNPINTDMIKENIENLEMCKKHGYNYILIDDDYKLDIIL